MPEYPQNPDGSVTINGRNYRIGFHIAGWNLLDTSDPSRLRRVGRRENIISLPPGDEAGLFHYTSLSGLQGIVEEEGFWASDTRFMNDAQETKHGIQVVREVIEHCCRRSRCTQFAEILTAVGQALSVSKIRVLVACFSRARDSLEQWRAYGPDGAVCIRLGNTPNARPLFFAPDQMPHNALYNPRAKVTMLCSIIRRYEKEYLLDRKSMPGYWPDDHDAQYIQHLSSTLNHHLVLFKNPAFEHEREVRVVLPFSGDEFEGGIKFRSSRLGLVPYVSTGRRVGLHGRLPIAEVIIGPSARQELIEESVRTFLDVRGYADAEVSCSEVPYRA